MVDTSDTAPIRWTGGVSTYGERYQSRWHAEATYVPPDGDPVKWLLKAFREGTAPDVIELLDVQVAIFESFAADLADDPDTQRRALALTGQYPRLAAVGVRDSRTAAVPTACAPLVMWFDRDALRRAGVRAAPDELHRAGTWNRAAFEQQLRQVARGGRPAMRLPLFWDALCSLITSLGGHAFDGAGRAIFDTDPAAKEIIAWLWRLRADGIVGGDTLSVQEDFMARDVAFMVYSTAHARTLTRDGEMPDWVGIAPLPTASGGIGPVSVPLTMMMVNRQSAAPNAARNFAARYVSVEEQRFRLATWQGLLPTRTDTDEVYAGDSWPAQDGWLADTVRAGWSAPEALATFDVWSDGTALSELSREKLDAAAFARRAARVLNMGAQK